jgi:hypothetical protein
MRNKRIAYRLMIPGFLLGVGFAVMALGVFGRNQFSDSDRLCFGASSCIAFVLGFVGVWFDMRSRS